MSDTQNLTTEKMSTDDTYKIIPYSQLPLTQQVWIDYCALQGVITNDDGSLEKMTIQECADKINVSRETLYAWKKSIPNFEDLCNERCAYMFNGARTRKVVNAIYLSATSKLNVQAMSLWMANQKSVEFRMPQQEVKHEAGNSWAALMSIKRSSSDGIVEGEVVSGTPQA
jgi:hypothetical protein